MSMAANIVARLRSLWPIGTQGATSSAGRTVDGAKQCPTVFILSPGLQGGVDRLIEHLDITRTNASTDVTMRHFVTHGPLVRGLALFPFRLVAFSFACIAGRIDLCHINFSVKGSTLRKVIFSSICRATGTPYILHLHSGSYPTFFRGLPGPMQSLVRSMCSQAKLIIALGTVWKRYIHEEIGIPEEKITILPNAVSGPEDAWDPEAERDEPPRILFLGRLGNNKGLPELSKALANPKLRNLSWTATLAGDGEVEKYRGEINKAGLADRVDVPGWTGPETVIDLLKRASILILPSHAENLPLSVLEGMAYGLSPIVTPVGAVIDVIRDGDNGILIPPGDADTIAGALSDLLLDPQKRRAIGKRARASFKADYDIRNYRGKLEAIYRTVLEHR